MRNVSSVEFRDVTKRFDDVVAVDALNLVVRDHEFLVLLGPSGCGKSTALRMIAGLDDPSDGEIVIGDRVVNDIDPKDRDVAMVFQSYALYPHMTVRKNIEFPLDARRVSNADRSKLVDEAATRLGLGELLNRKPAQLSGGQRQRVALARAIVRRPQVFLMDEPLSNLDAKLRVQTRIELVELQQSLSTTLVYVTHDQIEAMTMGHRIAIMRDGVLQQVGAPQDVYAQPANRFVAEFIGTPPMNVFSAMVDDGLLRVGGSTLECTPDDAASMHRGAILVGVRPEAFSFADGAAVEDANDSLAAIVMTIESLGHERHVHCRLASGAGVIVRVAGHDACPEPSTPVRLRVAERGLHLFDDVTEQRCDAHG